MEWDVSEHPDHPDGDLVSLKLRALTPDGIRMAIAKEYGLSNYREVMLQLKLAVYTFSMWSCVSVSKDAFAVWLTRLL